MRDTGFETFYEMVLSDEALQRQLRDIDQADEFIARVVELGEERGFSFTEDDVQEAMRTSRRAWLERSI